MKKLQLKALNLGAREILTRDQMKTINGGCTSSQDCGALQPYCVGQVCVGGTAQGGSGGSGPGGSQNTGGIDQTCNNGQGGSCEKPDGTQGTTVIPMYYSIALGGCAVDPHYQSYCG